MESIKAEVENHRLRSAPVGLTLPDFKIGFYVDDRVIEFREVDEVAENEIILFGHEKFGEISVIVETGSLLFSTA